MDAIDEGGVRFLWKERGDYYGLSIKVKGLH